MTIENTETNVTRRQFLTTATVGGVGLVAGAVGGVAVVTGASAPEQLELIKLRALLKLYEQLEKVGIDGIIAAGIGVVRGAVDTVRAGVKLARDGVAAVQVALNNFQTLIDNLRGVADGAARVLNDLLQKYKAAETLVVTALGNARPLAESIGNFFTELISKIPFGIGDNLLKAIYGLTELIKGVPLAIDAMLNQLLKPLSDLFFPPSGNAQMKTSLVDPINQNLLTPLAKFLADVDALAASWDKDLVQPVQAALDERAKVRKQIVAMRNDIGWV